MDKNNILFHKIAPKFAFCEKSICANYNQFFTNKKIIYRKLTSGFDNKIERNCFIAIDTSQVPKSGDLTLFDFGTDCECLNEYNGESKFFGKLIAYSAVNDPTKFYSSIKFRKEKPTTPILIPRNTSEFTEVLEVLLNSGLLKDYLYKNLDQLYQSLDLFEILLNEQYGEKGDSYE